MQRLVARIAIVLAVLLVALFVSPLAPAPGAAAGDPPKASPKDLAFLAGTWEGEMWGGVFHTTYAAEEWVVLSYSELRKEGKVSFHEFEKFELSGGALVFSPFPGGRPATQLTATSVDAKAKKAVFENPAKDWPTRIEYHRKADDRLVITLSDPHHEGGKTEVFDLKRK
jgi:hypothetical protein